MGQNNRNEDDCDDGFLIYGENEDYDGHQPEKAQEAVMMIKFRR